MRIKVKQIMAATLITASMLMMGGCDVASTPVAPAPSVGVTDEFTKPWEHSKVFLSDVGDTLKYKNSNYEEIYEDTLKELTKVDGKFEEYFGNQIYTTKDGVEVIISGTDLRSVEDLFQRPVYMEKTGEKPYRFEELSKYYWEDLKQIDINKILNNEYLSITSEGLDLILNYTVYKVDNLVHQAPDGKYAVDIKEFAKRAQFDLEIDEVAKTFKLTNTTFESFAPVFEHTYSDKAFEKMENSVGDMYYKPWYKEGEYLLVTIEQLRAHTGWTVEYIAENNILAINTDDLFGMMESNTKLLFKHEYAKTEDGRKIIVTRDVMNNLVDGGGNIITTDSNGKVIGTPPPVPTDGKPVDDKTNTGNTTDNPSSGNQPETPVKPTDPVKPNKPAPEPPPPNTVVGPPPGQNANSMDPTYPKPEKPTKGDYVWSPCVGWIYLTGEEYLDAELIDIDEIPGGWTTDAGIWK